MRTTLILHRDSRCDAVARMEAEIVRPQTNVLVLRYEATGRSDGVVLPSIADPARSNGLWRHTCFEAFLRADEGEAYYEFNFAPSRQWAAYRFDAYRTGMRVTDHVEPVISVDADEAGFKLEASLTFSGFPANATWRLGLSAVIEESNGNLSYWAIRHPRGKPDFHHPDSFVLELAMLEGPR